MSVFGTDKGGTQFRSQDLFSSKVLFLLILVQVCTSCGFRVAASSSLYPNGLVDGPNWLIAAPHTVSGNGLHGLGNIFRRSNLAVSGNGLHNLIDNPYLTVSENKLHDLILSYLTVSTKKELYGFGTVSHMSYLTTSQKRLCSFDAVYCSPYLTVSENKLHDLILSAKKELYGFGTVSHMSCLTTSQKRLCSFDAVYCSPYLTVSENRLYGLIGRRLYSLTTMPRGPYLTISGNVLYSLTAASCGPPLTVLRISIYSLIAMCCCLHLILLGNILYGLIAVSHSLYLAASGNRFNSLTAASCGPSLTVFWISIYSLIAMCCCLHLILLGNTLYVVSRSLYLAVSGNGLYSLIAMCCLYLILLGNILYGLIAVSRLYKAVSGISLIAISQRPYLTCLDFTFWFFFFGYYIIFLHLKVINKNNTQKCYYKKERIIGGKELCCCLHSVKHNVSSLSSTFRNDVQKTSIHWTGFTSLKLRKSLFLIWLLLSGVVCSPPVFLDDPVSVIAAHGTPTEFSCIAENAEEIVFRVNGSSASLESVRDKGFFQHFEEALSETLRRRNLTVTASVNYNNTKIFCIAIGSELDFVKSETANLTVQGPLSSVGDLSSYFINSSTVHISWSPPFTLPGTAITGYNISVNSNGTTTNYFTSDSYYVLRLSDIIDSPCNEINITVSGYNGLNGEMSLPIILYLPSVPSTDTLIPIRVANLKERVDMVNITLQINVTNICPGEYPDCIDIHILFDNHTLVAVHENISVSVTTQLTDVSEFTLTPDQRYIAIVYFENIAGEFNTISTVNFSTHAVQSISSVDVTGPVVAFECIFAPNTEAIGCFVQIVLLSNENVTSEMTANRTGDIAVVTFYDVLSGEHLLLVFEIEKDSSMILVLTKSVNVLSRISTVERTSMTSAKTQLGTQELSIATTTSSPFTSPEQTVMISVQDRVEDNFFIIGAFSGLAISVGFFSAIVSALLLLRKRKRIASKSISKQGNETGVSNPTATVTTTNLGIYRLANPLSDVQKTDSDSYVQNPMEVQDPGQKDSMEETRRFVSGMQHNLDRTSTTTFSSTHPLLTENEYLTNLGKEQKLNIDQKTAEVGSTTVDCGNIEEESKQVSKNSGPAAFISGRQEYDSGSSESSTTLLLPLEKHDHAEVEPSDKFKSEVAQHQSRTSPSAEQPSETKPTAEKQPVYAEVLHMKGPKVPLSQEPSNYSIVDHKATALPIKNNQKEKLLQADHKATAQLSSEPEPPPLPLKNIQRKTGTQEGNSSFCEFDLKDSHF